MTVGNRLRRSREQQVLTQEDLAVRSGVTGITISRIENGHHTPRPSTARKLAQALDVNPRWLLHGECENEDHK